MIYRLFLNCQSYSDYTHTARKVSKYGVFPGPHFLAFGLNIGKYGPEKTPYLDTFHALSKRKIKHHVTPQSKKYFQKILQSLPEN